MDVKALNIHLQVDVKLNELAKQILLLLPLLLLLLLLLYVLYHVLIQGGEAPLYNYVVKYKALLVVDVVKLTVSLTGLIIMLTTPWHLA